MGLLLQSFRQMLQSEPMLKELALRAAPPLPIALKYMRRWVRYKRKAWMMVPMPGDRG